jgi:hypothetical protein
MQDKLQILAGLLFQSEQENRHLRNIIKCKDLEIKELNAEICFSDLEVQEIRCLLEKSVDVEHLNFLQIKISELHKTIDALKYEITL